MNDRFVFGLLILLALVPLASAAEPPAEKFDVVIKGGTLYDDTGEKPRIIDVTIRGDRMAAPGKYSANQAKSVSDAKGLAVAPGFINMLSWSTDSLIGDGRSRRETR